MGGLIATLATTRLIGPGALGPIALGLIYPNSELTLTLASAASPVHNPLPLMLEDLRFMVDNLGTTGREKEFSPLHPPGTANWPPTFVAVAEWDVLADEGRKFAANLAAQGIDVALLEAAGVSHGYMADRSTLPSASRATSMMLAMLNTFCLQVATRHAGAPAGG
jgi:acetyl esterase